tara:strand:+ start:3817 stop:4434 length:618 start_codon:yes stop_codon:yes gene_type:complete
MYKKIIVFEGIDGSGKTYHINEVSKYLTKKRINFIKIREPGGSENSEIIRKLILNKKSNLKKKTDLLLYLAARNENFESLIKPNINKKVILLDRFIYSTVAYQHYGFKINKIIINNLNHFILGNIKPNFTFLHIVPLKDIKKKISGRKNKYDNFNKEFYKKVQRGFLKILKHDKNKCIIDTSHTKKYNTEIIRKQINKLLKIDDK